jgi:hypothetical protein
LGEVAQVIGFSFLRSLDYMPENSATLADAAKALLKVDKEHFGGKYHEAWLEQLQERQVLPDWRIQTAVQGGSKGVLRRAGGSLGEWLDHESKVEKLGLRLMPETASRQSANALVQANVDRLVGPGLGLRLQPGHEHMTDAYGYQIVRVQLTEGRGWRAKPVGNHGILVFRPNGTLADYHSPLPRGLSNKQALELLKEARQMGLDQDGAEICLVPDAEGNVEAMTFQHEREGIVPILTIHGTRHPEPQRVNLARLAMKTYSYKAPQQS